MVEVLIGLGVVVAFFWLLLGPGFAKYIHTETIGYRWVVHLSILPWYLVGISSLLLVCYKIGEAIRG